MEKLTARELTDDMLQVLRVYHKRGNSLQPLVDKTVNPVVFDPYWFRDSEGRMYRLEELDRH